jgi:hypothetical protein
MKKFITSTFLASLTSISFAFPSAIDSDYTVKAGETENVTSKCEFAKTSTLTVNGTLSFDTNEQYALRINSDSSVIVADGGKLIAPKSTSVYSDVASNFVLTKGNLIVEEGGYVQNGKIGMENGTLTINQENGITGMIDSHYKYAFICPVTKNGIVKLNASQGFVADMRKDTKLTFKKDVGNDAILTISDTYINGAVNNTSASFTLENFDTRSFFLETGNHSVFSLTENDTKLFVTFTDPSNSAVRNQTYSFYSLINGQEVAFESIVLESGINNGVSGYWVYDSALVAVPEPAEWAIIFGAIALGLAVYRRRK